MMMMIIVIIIIINLYKSVINQIIWIAMVTRMECKIGNNLEI